MDTLYENTGRIGGPGHVVEIDETKVGKRKYNRGRMVDGTWIFGMIDIGTEHQQPEPGAYRLEICPNNERTEAALVPLIQKHVEVGSVIMSDGWASYGNLERYGYEHLSVNHTENFVDPLTFAHTQNIERSWKPLKAKLTGTGIRKQYLADHMCEFLWRREERISAKQEGRKAAYFGALIRDIAAIDTW